MVLTCSGCFIKNREIGRLTARVEELEAPPPNDAFVEHARESRAFRAMVARGWFIGKWNTNNIWAVYHHAQPFSSPLGTGPTPTEAIENALKREAKP